MNKTKVISVICSMIAIILAGVALFFGISAIGATGLSSIGTILIIPSVLVMMIVVTELLITLLSTRKGLIFSYIIGMIKLFALAALLYVSCKDLIYELQYGNSNITLDLTAIVGLFIISVPTLFNIIRLRNNRQK